MAYTCAQPEKGINLNITHCATDFDTPTKERLKVDDLLIIFTRI